MYGTEQQTSVHTFTTHFNTRELINRVFIHPHSILIKHPDTVITDVNNLMCTLTHLMCLRCYECTLCNYTLTLSVFTFLQVFSYRYFSQV